MDNRYSLITGASGGIGGKLCIEYSNNHNVILCGSNIDKLEKVCNLCNKKRKHLLWAVDFAKERQTIFESLTQFIKDNNIVIDSFVHCAGITTILPIKNFAPIYVDKIFNINVFSAIEILRCLLKKINKDTLENVIFVSALWSIRGNVGNSIYAASKGALNSLTYSLAQELAPKVRVNSVLPGYILTPMSENLNKEYMEQLRKETPLGIGSTEDVINYILFLLSDKAKWVTGQNIVIDGGRSTK